MRLATLFLAAAVLAAPALAHHDGDIAERNGIRVSHAHTTAPARTADGIHVYLTLESTGGAADRLVSAAVPFAAPGRFEANVLSADGVLAVQPVSAIAVAPGQRLSLEPGSARIVFDDVQRTLDSGGHFDMILTFENAGPLEVEVEIEAADDSDHAPEKDGPAS